MIEVFATQYFSFLLSGRVEDFKGASEAFYAALERGFTLEELQTSMDDSHSSAEVLCLFLDNPSVKKLG